MYGIRFIAINDNVDSYKDPKSVDNAIVPFKNLMNDEYCRDISNKVKSVLNAKKKNGEFCGGMTPYGYSRDPEDKHHFVINQDEAKIIKMIFNKALEGKGRTTIAMELNDSNILSIREIRRRERLAKKGIECDNNLKYYWAGTHVYEILKNEMYCGDMIQCRFKSISYKNHKIVRVPEDEWIIVRNTHEAIIDRETFDKVQKILDKRKNTNPKKGKKSIFAGFMKCYDCKQKMVKKSSYKRADGYQVYNYYCSLNTLKSYKLCSKHKIRNDDLEKAVLESINLQISLVIDLEKTIQEVKKKKKNEINSDLLRKQIKQKEGEYNKIRKLKKSVYEDWKLEIISREDFEMYSRDYEQRTSNIELELKILKDKMKEEQEGKYIDDKWIDIFMKNQNLDKLTRNVLEELIECIYVHEDGKITIDFKYQDEYNQALKFIKS